MISNNDNSTDGKSSQTRSKGSVCTVGSRNLPLYRLVIVCLGLLNTVLMLAAIVIGIYCGKVSEGPVPHEITVDALILEVRQLQIMHTEVIKAEEEANLALKEELNNHKQLKLQFEKSRALCDDFQRQLEILEVNRATLQSHTSDLLESCGHCPPGWLLFNTSCYFHSQSRSKSWSDSRDDCIRRGADLTVIDNWEEQLNLYEHLPKPLPGTRPQISGIWIGLKKIQTGDGWVWINNVTLQNEGYWIQLPANNRNNHCAALVKSNNPSRMWLEAGCQENRQWLCEMEPN